MTELVERIKAQLDGQTFGPKASATVALSGDQWAKIIAALEAREWRDIATPPEAHGTYLVVDDRAFTCQWHFGHWDGSAWTSGDAGTPITPTHWLPLPTPATEGEA